MNVSARDRARYALSRLRELFLRDRIRRELDEELRTHLALEIEHNLARGMTLAEARRAARLAFGGVERFREEATDARGIVWLDHIARDLRFALRQLRRAPSFTTSVVLTLAIGAGASTAIFAVLSAVLIKPLPYSNPDRLAGVWYNFPGLGINHASQSMGTYFTIRRFARTIDGIAISQRTAVNLASADDAAHPERAVAARVSASAFRLLGAPFVRGRAFVESEDAPHAAPVAVISEGFWRRRFGAEPSAVGRSILVDGQLREIVGIVSSRFRFPDDRTDLWVPVALDSTNTIAGTFAYPGFVRLKDGVTIDAAQRELGQLLGRVGELYPDIGPGFPTGPFMAEGRGTVAVHPLRDDVVGNFGGIMFIAATAAGLLLLISFANVANLLLARAESRQRELAVRIALGAGARRVLGQFLVESVVLASIGGACGLLLAAIGIRLLVRAAPPAIPRLEEIGVDGSVIAFAAVIALTTGVLCALVPALRYDVKRLSSRLRDGARGSSSGRDRQRARRALVVTQVAFATMLVSGAALMFQSLQRLQRTDPGFDPAHVLTLRLSPPKLAYPSDTAVSRLSSRLLASVASVPGVRSVGIASKLPLSTSGATFTPVWSDAAERSASASAPSKEVMSVTGGYFAAMGIHLSAGKTFDVAERQRPYEAIVDRTLAREYWGDSTGTSVIGRRIRTSNDPAREKWYTVTGVVESVADMSLATAPSGIVYLPDVVTPDPSDDQVTRAITLVMRTSGDPGAVTHGVQRAIAEVDGSIPPFDVRPMAEVVEQSMARLWFVLVIIGVIASVALTLAAVGLYGVLAFMVSTRGRELSVRMAMGALPSAVAGLVTRQAVALSLIGIMVGASVFLVLSRYLRSMMTGIQSPNPATLAAVSLVLLAVTVIASWVPARRAAGTDPARALAAE